MREIDLICSSQAFDFFILVGDFNVILRSDDSRGGVGRKLQSQLDFKDFVDRNSLFEIPMGNGTFTWTNRRLGFSNIAKKLDKFLFKGDLSKFLYSLECKILPISGSDHYPIHLEIIREGRLARCPFKFENMWFKDPSFMELVKQWWTQINQEGFKFFNIVTKLKYIKKNIKVWNKECFKNIFEEKRNVEDELAVINEKIIYEGMDGNSFWLEKDLLGKMGNLTSKDETF